MASPFVLMLLLWQGAERPPSQDQRFSVFLAKDPSSWVGAYRANDNSSTRRNRPQCSFLRFFTKNQNKLACHLLMCATLPYVLPAFTSQSCPFIILLSLNQMSHASLYPSPDLHSKLACPPGSILCSSPFLAFSKKCS